MHQRTTLTSQYIYIYIYICEIQQNIFSEHILLERDLYTESPDSEGFQISGLSITTFCSLTLRLARVEYWGYSTQKF